MKKVDLQFSVRGKKIPADHGYLLLSAIAKIVPEVHGDDAIGIHPINGQLIGGRALAVTNKSRLTIRLPVERIKQFLPLAGKALFIGEDTIQLGVPQTRPLIPAARLYSRLVIIKGFMEPDAFLKAVQRQLDAAGIKGVPSLIPQSDIAEANRDKKAGTHSDYLRRTIQIRGREIVGFSLRVEQLTAEESILLQERGIGGRRRFGCGIFIPERR